MDEFWNLIDDQPLPIVMCTVLVLVGAGVLAIALLIEVGRALVSGERGAWTLLGTVSGLTGVAWWLKRLARRRSIAQAVQERLR